MNRIGYGEALLYGLEILYFEALTMILSGALLLWGLGGLSLDPIALDAGRFLSGILGGFLVMACANVGIAYKVVADANLRAAEDTDRSN